MYIRYLEAIVQDLIQEFRIIYITGPRQAGKTTMVRSIAEKNQCRYLTLDDQSTLAAIRHDPHGYIRSLGEEIFIIDEFQYAPEMIPAIKEASDLSTRSTCKFILTGSADIFRSAKTQEALPGHMARLELYPLSMSELTNQPQNIIDVLLERDIKTYTINTITREQIAKFILLGGYPEPQTKTPRGKSIWYKSYIEGRFYKDFESLYVARGDYHSKIKALTPYLAGLCGNLLKYSNVGNDLGLNDKVIKTYIEILDLMFIVRRLPAYLKNVSKTLTTIPKLHFIDTGLACHLLGLKSEAQILKSQFYGGLLENLLFMEICKQATWADEDVTLHHFRDNRKNEVDLVLEQTNGEIIGIEVKASASVNLRDFKGLSVLAEYAGKKFKQGYLFYTGNHVLPFRYNEFVFQALPISLIIGEVNQ